MRFSEGPDQSPQAGREVRPLQALCTSEGERDLGVRVGIPRYPEEGAFSVGRQAIQPDRDDGKEELASGPPSAHPCPQGS